MYEGRPSGVKGLSYMGMVRVWWVGRRWKGPKGLESNKSAEADKGWTMPGVSTQFQEP